MSDLLRETIAANGTAEDLALYDAIVAESVARTEWLLTLERPNSRSDECPNGGSER
jgi:hypothetical protein